MGWAALRDKGGDGRGGAGDCANGLVSPFGSVDAPGYAAFMSTSKGPFVSPC